MQALIHILSPFPVLQAIQHVPLWHMLEDDKKCYKSHIRV